MEKTKLAILTSHPIQYQAPLFQKLAQCPEIDLTVYFCWDFGVKKESFDPEFGKKIKWDIPLLEGYKYEFLKNYSPKPSSCFWGQINPKIIIKKYDAIIIFGWNSFTNWLTFLTAFAMKIPVFLRGENPLNQEFLKPKWKIKIKKMVLGWLFKQISVFLYIGEENKKFYKFYGVYDEKLFFAPYAVDNERYLTASKKFGIKNYKLRKESKISKNDAVILFVGKLIEKKRPKDLLRAYENLLVCKKYSICLFFVGDGVLRPKLEKYAEEHNLKNVHFVGFKNQTELLKYYALADILVLPSGVGETWGLVVNEAMCFSLPIIVSDMVGCGADLVKEGENGHIFPLGNIKKLTHYLEDLVENNFKRISFGETSLEIIKNYNYKKNVKVILEELKNSCL